MKNRQSSASFAVPLVLTAAYCGQFEYGLTAGELWRRLIYKDHPFPLRNIPRDFPLFVDKKISPKWQKHRHQMQAVVRRKWQEVAFVLGWIQKIPWIDAVFITGGLAMSHATDGDDIDFLLITQVQRLWLCRIIVTFISWVFGKRRSWHGNEPNSWCFNMWLERDHLAMPLNRQSIYEAYEVFQAKPVWQRNSTLSDWYDQNQWISRWCPNWAESLQIGKVHMSTKKENTSQPHRSRFLDILNSAAYKLQYLYMQKHISQELVTPAQAFFHPRPTKKYIVDGWRHNIVQYNEPNALKFFDKFIASTHNFALSSQAKN